MYVVYIYTQIEYDNKHNERDFYSLRVKPWQRYHFSAAINLGFVL